MSRITQEDLIEFAKRLLVRCQETHPGAQVELNTDARGLFYVMLHTDSLQGQSECYTIDPISREWIKTYGSF